MELKNQVVSLELAKKMKELGFEQESVFYWADDEEGQWVLCIKTKLDEDPIVGYGEGLEEGANGGFLPAYTVAELGEMLPKKIKIHELSFLKHKQWWCGYCDLSDSYPELQNWICKESADTEADARAKMLIYLKENKLI